MCIYIEREIYPDMCIYIYIHVDACIHICMYAYMLCMFPNIGLQLRITHYVTIIMKLKVLVIIHVLASYCY